jgi:hypothetical protein
LNASGGATSRTEIDGRQVSVVENGTDPDSITVTIPKALAVGDKLFGRLQAEQP